MSKGKTLGPITDSTLVLMSRLSIFHSLPKTMLRMTACFSLVVLAPYLLTSKTLSNRAEISLMTIAPGAELYSAFGHTAIWVSDPLSGVNTMYNYGTFDFKPDSLTQFYLNFTQGRLNYRLDTESYRQFDYVYQYFKRSYFAQVLDLNQAQKQAVYDFLENNYLPANRYYLYEFFFDNCATRVRDLFQEVLGDSLTYVGAQASMEMSFRDLLHQYLEDRRWAKFGIDLALGAVVDRDITPWESMFLPDYLATEFDSAMVSGANGDYPLVKEVRRLYEGEAAVQVEPWYVWPITLFWVLFLVVLGVSYLGWRQRNHRRITDILLFSLSGLSGLILSLLWFATIHTATVHNWNILWLLPTHLVAGLMLIRPPKWLDKYFWLAAVCSAIPLLTWFLLPQTFHPAFLPWMLMLLLRSLYSARMLGASPR